MPWLQIKVHTAPEQAEQYEDLLLAAGCAAVTYQDAEDQPIYEPDLGTTPLWSSTQVTGLFAAEHDLEETLELLRNAQANLPMGDTCLSTFTAEIVEDKDWEREWMSHYHPMQFGDRFWICPSWSDPPDPDAINLMLDPGLAFGTGTHPTTALCLRWLASQDLNGKTVIDYGCGSGILGIAALLLGADKVIGVDIDPQALQATQDNLQRNGFSADRLPVYLPEQAPDLAADLVIANILAGPLKDLAPLLTRRVRISGQILLSGLLEKQADELAQHYSAGFDMEPAASDEDWVRLVGTRIREVSG